MEERKEFTQEKKKRNLGAETTNRRRTPRRTYESTKKEVQANVAETRKSRDKQI